MRDQEADQCPHEDHLDGVVPGAEDLSQIVALGEGVRRAQQRGRQDQDPGRFTVLFSVAPCVIHRQGQKSEQGADREGAHRVPRLARQSLEVGARVAGRPPETLRKRLRRGEIAEIRNVFHFVDFFFLI